MTQRLPHFQTMCECKVAVQHKREASFRPPWSKGGPFVLLTRLSQRRSGSAFCDPGCGSSTHGGQFSGTGKEGLGNSHNQHHVGAHAAA